MDSICRTSLGSRAGPLTPSTPVAVRAAQAAALTHRHPRPPIMNEAFPIYETALANLPEEPTPVKLPTLKAPQHSPEDLDAETTEPGLDPIAPQTGEALGPISPPTQQKHVDQPEVPISPLPQQSAEGPPSPTQTLPRMRRREILAAFLEAPRLPSASSLSMENIAFLLHLLLDTPERLATLSYLAQPLPPSEATTVWAGWKPHLAHEGETFPHGTLAHDAFLHILERPIPSLGDTAEVTELLRLFVTNRVSNKVLTTYIAGTPQEKQMAQSYKRGREDDEADLRDEEMA